MNLKFWETKKKEEKILKHNSFSRDTNWQYDPAYNLSQPLIDTRRYSGNFIPFGLGNTYPNILLGMYNGSPFHRALIEFKVKATMGSGFEVKMFEQGTNDIIEQKKIESKINRKFVSRFITDYIIHARAYIKITKLDNFKQIELIPAEQVRVNEDKTIFYVNKDWVRNRSEYDEFSAYNKLNKDNVQILEFSEDSPGFDVYSVPSYASAANWIWLDSEIAFFQKQNIENSINPSAIINFYQDIANKEEKRAFIDELQSSFSSAKNAGKVMVFFTNGKDLAPDIKIAEPNKLDESFADAQHNIIKNLAYAHGVNPVLMGVATEGKLGATSELNDTFNIFKNVWLDSFQQDIEDYLTQIANIITDKKVKVELIRKQNLI